MIQPSQVFSTLSQHILADGLDLVFDLEKSSGSYIVDKRNGSSYLDFFSMYASMAVGYNHPRLLAAQDQLGALAVQKPSSSDAYTDVFAEFVSDFGRSAMPSTMEHAFFIEGGALAVENALKAAFDWKIRLNFSRGAQHPIGNKIIHFKQAFHGRSGYTLSLTNTHDPRKTKYFPTLQWPRVINPKLSFPINAENTKHVQNMEEVAKQQIRNIIRDEKEDIAGLIIEPIQGEGGDNHFRPEFFAFLRTICNENDILFIVDEIQSGMGLTGKMWAHQHYNTAPDIICFGKKTQVCGFMASKRIDEVENNVFQESSRINSTFGGNLVDMARCSHILQIMEEDRLVENARVQGERLLHHIHNLVEEFPEFISNPRGKGLMCAFDLASEEMRNTFVQKMFAQKVVVLGCGARSIRFRPHLIVNEVEIDAGMDMARQVIAKMVA